MILPVVFDPNEILHQRARDLEISDWTTKKFPTLITDMIETMYAKDGVGLAAPQIGESLQLCVIAKNFTPGKKKDLVLLNPRWEKTSRRTQWDDEGCLSIPGLFGKVKRWRDIQVSALDEKGKQITFVAEDFFARIVQHEVDHLNGTLFIDRAKDLYQVERKK